MVDFPRFVPSALDLAWASSLLRCIADDGIWLCPSAELIYTVSHREMMLTLTLGDADDETHRRNKIVFAKLGYKMKEGICT